MNLKISYRDVDTALSAQKMFNLRQKSTVAIIEGKFREARNIQKEFAKLAVDDFETFKTLPSVRFKNVPFKPSVSIFFKSLQFKLFRMFTKKSPEEKLFRQKYNEYIKEIDKNNQVRERVDITLPSY